MAALIGTLFILWGQLMADPIASIALATNIAYNGVRLFIENSSYPPGRCAGPEFLTRLESLARFVPLVLGVRNLRAECIGPDTMHAGMYIAVEPDLTVQERERIGKEVHARVCQRIPSGFCLIQVEPAVARRPVSSAG